MPSYRSAVQPQSDSDSLFVNTTFQARPPFDFSMSPTQDSVAHFAGFNRESNSGHMFNSPYCSPGDDMIQEFFANPKDAFSMGTNDFHSSQSRLHVDPASVWQMESQAHGEVRMGAQTTPQYQRPSQLDIVNSRRSQVSERLGQITPPDEDAQMFPMASPAQARKRLSRDDDTGKLSNEQRARNAANHRHHKPKRSKSNGDSEDDVGEEGQKEGKSLALQREKNRIAAAKCRAKKKAGNETRQEEARDKAATNDYLSRHVRELRDERSRLRSLILAHDPDVCGCRDIHQFNINEARKLVFGVGGRTGMPSRSPPWLASSPSLHSPSSDAPLSGSPFDINQAPTSRSQSLSSGKRSTHDSGFDQFSSLDTMHSNDAKTSDGQLMAQEFSEFLYNSPGARTAYL